MICDVALIGFGEAGSTFALAGQWGARARAFDIDAARRTVMSAAGIGPSAQAAEALADAPIILSLVTADQALLAAEAYAPLLRPGALWCDLNSVAPDTKRAAAKVVEAAGACYIDVAVLAPVDPARLAVPLLIAGAAAQPALDRLTALGFTRARIVGDEIGRASAIKMIRSVMVKGIEALTAEMMAAATAAGVVEEVLNSLDASEKAIGWRERAAYNLERMQVHGLRRAAEMEEVAKTLVALDVTPMMTEGTIVRQREMGRPTKQQEQAQ